MSAVGSPDANYSKVSDGNSLFSTTEWKKKKKDSFVTKERVIMFKNVNNIETFLMEMRGSI